MALPTTSRLSLSDHSSYGCMSARGFPKVLHLPRPPGACIKVHQLSFGVGAQLASKVAPHWLDWAIEEVCVHTKVGGSDKTSLV